MSNDATVVEPDPRFVTYAATRDPELRNRLVEDNRGLALAMARRYSGHAGRDDDLAQVAQLALVQAVERFDPGRGVRFSTFAVRTVVGELKRYFRDRTWSLKVPRPLQERAVSVRSAVDTLTQRLGRSPTVPEVAAELGATVDDVVAALDASSAYRADSLDRPNEEDDEPTPVGVADTGLRSAESAMAFRQLIETLPERERRIVELRFVDELSQSAIAAQLGISQMHVSRLLRRSLDQLRRTMEEEKD